MDTAVRMRVAYKSVFSWNKKEMTSRLRRKSGLLSNSDKTVPYLIPVFLKTTKEKKEKWLVEFCEAARPPSLHRGSSIVIKTKMFICSQQLSLMLLLNVG